MTNLPEWVGKVTTSWVAVGTLLIVLSSQGAPLPEQVIDIFSQTFVDEVLKVTGSVITFAQFIRAIFAAKEGEVQTLSASSKRSFALNPLKFTL